VPKEYPRVARINTQIQRELAEIIRDELRDPRVKGVTVTSVDVAPDMRNANVRVSVLALDGKPDEAAVALNGAAPKLRQSLKHRLRLRHIPELRFHGDVTTAIANRLNKLIKEAREEDRKHHDGNGEPEA
jgi:ribosome-binding factor A